MMAPMASGSGTLVNGSLVGGPGQVVVAPKKGDLVRFFRRLERADLLKLTSDAARLLASSARSVSSRSTRLRVLARRLTSSGAPACVFRCSPQHTPVLTRRSPCSQPHTVTQSSQLSICNASQQAGAFKSGMQQAGFQMPLTVNDSSTIFYYCAVPNHCQKGMVRPLSPHRRKGHG